MERDPTPRGPRPDTPRPAPGVGRSAPRGGRGLAWPGREARSHWLAPAASRLPALPAAAGPARQQQPAARAARDQIQFSSPVVAVAAAAAAVAVLGWLPFRPVGPSALRPFAARAGLARDDTPTVTRVAKCLRSVPSLGSANVTLLACSAVAPGRRGAAPAYQTNGRSVCWALR